MLACAGEPQPTTSAASAAEDVRRLAAILDYVAADYGAAVSDGKVVNAFEYAEQLEFLQQAAEYSQKLPSASVPVGERLMTLRAMVDGRGDAETVAKHCRALRRELLTAYGVVLAPRQAPSFDRGLAVYREACMRCHGERGGGDGPSAAELQPPTPKPRSFLDPEVMEGVSPVRVYNAVTDGLAGTAMASFAAYAQHDRWSVAFYVLTLRHAGVAQKSAAEFATPDLAVLAEKSDGELRADLQGQGVTDAPGAIAALRVHAAFTQRERPLQASARLVQEARDAYARGTAAAAKDAVTGAYLDGFEGVETALRARDANLVLEVEKAFADLRQQITTGASVDIVNAAATNVLAELQRAEGLLAQDSGWWVALAAAATVLLREGIESVLLVLLLLGLARRVGTQRDRRSIHLGWATALGVGVILWFVTGHVLLLSGMQREVLEGLIALLAAAVLLYASHVVIARLDARRRVEALKARFAGAGERRRRAVLFGLAFAAVFREALEVVLFLRAILVETPAAGWAVAMGAAVGLLACVVLVVVLQASGRRLNPGQVLAVSGTLLCGLAIVMAGKGIRALQEASVLPTSTLDLPRIDWLGVYPTVQTLAAQGFVVAVIAVVSVVGLRRSARAPT